MFRLLSLATVCALTLTISTPSVQADDSAPLVDKRQARQAGRIVDGAKSGELTRREARSLVRGQKRIRRMKRRAAEDGEITDEERRRIRRAQRRQSADIYRKKHNQSSRQ